MKLQSLSVHNCRFQAPGREVERALEPGVFRLAVPDHIQLRDAYLQLVRSCARTEAQMAPASSCLNIDTATLPVRLAGALWAIAKLVRQAAIAVGLHYKADLLLIDRLMRESNDACLQFCLAQVGGSHSRPDPAWLGGDTMLACAAYSLDEVLQHGQGIKIAPSPKELVIIPGQALSPNPPALMQWAPSAVRTRTTTGRHCLILRFDRQD